MAPGLCLRCLDRAAREAELVALLRQLVAAWERDPRGAEVRGLVERVRATVVR